MENQVRTKSSWLAFWKSFAGFPWSLSLLLVSAMINARLGDNWMNLVASSLCCGIIIFMFCLKRDTEKGWESLADKYRACCGKFVAAFGDWNCVSNRQDRLMDAMCSRIKELEDKYEPDAQTSLYRLQELRQELSKSRALFVVPEQSDNPGTAS